MALNGAILTSPSVGDPVYGRFRGMAIRFARRRRIFDLVPANSWEGKEEIRFTFYPALPK